LKTFKQMEQLHDLGIILAWTGSVTGIMLYTYFHRSCAAFTSQGDLSAPCQSLWDIAFVFVAALGASLTLNDERIAVVGFLFVHFAASGLFVLALSMPSVLGVVDPGVSDALLTRSVSIAFRYDFPPFSLVTSFIGRFIGLFVAGTFDL